MIKSFTITNAFGKTLELELESPEKSGFLVQEVDGLGPPKANIATTNLTTTDGSLYNSARVSSRNIVFRLIFLPTKPYSGVNAPESIENTRQKSYMFFPIKKRIKIKVKTDNRECEIYGYVESNETTIFNTTMVGAVISVLCPDPYFYSVGENEYTETLFYGSESLFEFPFGNEGDLATIEFGRIINIPEKIIQYSGDAETGIRIFLRAVNPVRNITLYNTQTRTFFKIDTNKLVSLTGAEFGAGDTIEITTIKRNKSIFLIRNGEYINIINCVDRKSDWFQLVKGDNVFTYIVEVGSDNLEMRIVNPTLYEGV